MKKPTDASCATNCGPACTPLPFAGFPETAEDFANELAELAKALGHPARIRILRLLAERRECVCGTIVDEVGLAQSTVSQHLAVLKAAGLIQGEVDGPRVCYCVNLAMLQRCKILVAAL